MAQAHRFGGLWTERKLEAVRYYLEFYTGALRGQPFDLWYIDAFAGSGDRVVEQEIGGMFENMPITRTDIVLDGSAKRAMAIEPPFKHLLFMEPDSERFNALSKLGEADPRVECLQGDANELLPSIFARREWERRGSAKGRQRGVVFLDPYGMQVSWSTLEILAATQRVDVWYLFPLAAVNRQLAHNPAAIDKAKEEALNRCLGGTGWRSEMYQPSNQRSMFDTPMDDQRGVSLDQIEAYFHRKLGKLFSWASDPLPLFLNGGQQIFSLFLLIANDSHAAVNLARSGMKDLSKRYATQAFHRRFAL